VTGAGSDIGSAVCVELASMGATVRATDLDRSELTALGARDDRILTTPADLTSVTEITALGAGAADIFVSVAGLAHIERFEEGDPERWDLLWKVNLRAPMLLTRELMGSMMRRGWGRLVYISSESARAGAGGEAAYAATKAGLLGLAKSIAREVAASGLTANVVSPGLIETATSDRLLESRPGMREAFLRAVPARRLGHPDEVAAAVAYLCSPQSGYVTGQVLSVNGGIAMG